MRILFMGSPEFALPTLQALIASHDVCGVVTQPDRPAGRGRELQPPPVKRAALQHGLDVFQSKSLKDNDVRAWISERSPEAIVVAAFGQIVPPKILELPPFGCLNVHASLLPRWRGAAPVQAAIAAGDDQTGVTIMQMDKGLDTGDILTQRATSIEPAETGGELAERLAQLGADLLIETLALLQSGNATPQAQDESRATYAPRLHKRDGLLEFDRPVSSLALLVRAYQPWPGTFFEWDKARIKVLQATAQQAELSQPPGTKGVAAGVPAVAAQDGWLLLERVLPAGKTSMTGPEFLNGAPSWPSFEFKMSGE